ncbi:MAG: fibrobacter succinogenes major paralogous domain-containing protein [Bacteroidales bacterium]|jgi:uncharacterized protein (TIGR02145 family)|nr:fibrobacter succinogenes major paralogous domain-containing protein [Bacteroidales bacterium]
MMKSALVLIAVSLTFVFSVNAYSQGISISQTNAPPDPSAMLDVQSTGKGMLIPRMTQVQRDAIPEPATGLLIYQTDNEAGFYFNAGTPGSPSWQAIAGSDGIWQQSGDNVYRINGNLGLGTNDPSQKLDLNGQVRIRGGAPGNGKVLTSDEEGNATWQMPPAVSPGSNMQTLRHDGTGWIADGLLRNNGTGLGIGALPIINNQLFLQRPSGNYGAGYANIYANRSGFPGIAENGGTSWNATGVDAAIKGFSDWGNNFSAAIAGYGYLDFANSAAVIGSNNSGNVYGALAFKDASNTLWAGFYNGNVNINGSLSLQGGAPGEGKVLTSDANGNATWQSPSGNSAMSCIDIDGNAYPTTSIGNQVWMAENLRVTKYRNGDPIPNVTGNTAWEALTSGAWCWYDNNQVANSKYGALYNWYAVTDSRGLCPEGWRTPTDEEWTTFITMLGGANVAGGKLKATSPLWIAPNTDATNSTGFSALPGGERRPWGAFNSKNESGNFWSSAEITATTVWYRLVGYNIGDILRYSSEGKTAGYSVRCLKD